MGATPRAMAMPGLGFAQPQAPPSLLQGLPDVKTTAACADQYNKRLDEQCADQQKLIRAAAEQQQKMYEAQLELQASQAKMNARYQYGLQGAAAWDKQFEIQMEAQRKALPGVIQQQQNLQLQQIEQARQVQQNAVKTTAAQYELEYNQRKAQDDALQKQFQIQKDFAEAEIKLSRDLFNTENNLLQRQMTQPSVQQPFVQQPFVQQPLVQQQFLQQPLVLQPFAALPAGHLV